MAKTLYDTAMASSLNSRVMARKESGLRCDDIGIVEELRYQLENASWNMEDDPEYWGEIIKDCKRLLNTQRARKALANGWA